MDSNSSLCDSELVSVGHTAHEVAEIQRRQQVVGDETSAAIDWNT